jgi:hypothetical protein
MHIGIYHRPNAPMGHIFKAIKQGAEFLGHTCAWRNPGPFTSDQVEAFDLIAIWGRFSGNEKVHQAYQAKGVPVLVVEGAYLDPGPDRVALGIGKHYWLPEKIGGKTRGPDISLLPRQEGGDYILICGQENPHWCNKTAQNFRFVTDRETVFRPHPRRPDACKNAHRVTRDTSLEQDMAGAWMVACETSNVGTLALMAGKPVFCHPRAMYAHLANTDLLSVEDPFFPTDEQRRDYLARLAWAIWEKPELEDGTALQFYLWAIQEGGKARPNEVSTLAPSSLEDKITVITPTGDRPEALALLRQWMTNQTRQPDQWLIIDDGQKPVKKREFAGATVIRRKPSKLDPPCTLGENLKAALPLVAHDKILIMEDDDWYGPEYIETMAQFLDAHDLVGISGTKYYHPGVPGFREMGRGDHASLSQTAFRKSYLPKIIEAIPFDSSMPEYPECSVDMRIWKKANGRAHLVAGADKKLHCSIKGLPGRKGAGVGHDKKYYTKDKNLTKFREWCGDVEAYGEFIKGL